MTGLLYDANLFSAIDGLGAPLTGNEVIRAGYNDGYLDKKDGYAKVRGRVAMATSKSAWESEEASKGRTIHDQMRGPIVAENRGAAVKFDAADDIFDLNPQNFEPCANVYRSMSAVGDREEGVVRSGSYIANTTLASSDANGGTVTERTPLGSTKYQATYLRPVFRNMTFKNVTIPKGLNALFENCTFDGVTFVDTERNIIDYNASGHPQINDDPGKAWNWVKKAIASGTKLPSKFEDRVLIGSGTPAAGQQRTHGSAYGNNLRFHNCTMRGPIANNYATAYTHCANSWEFTGETKFENLVDQTATIVAPQTNIEMGSFTNPNEAPSTLIGVVVAGNIDIRGTSVVDGSIVVTGNGAGNTTLGYFGSDDSDTDPAAMPEGGFGRLNLRYNPSRTLPDGIMVPVDVLPVAGSYREANR